MSADSRNESVWTVHAAEQWETNKTGHFCNDDYLLRKTLLTLPGVKRCLDLGCGGGLWRRVFNGLEYVGADQNETMISYARKRFPASVFVVCPGEKTPFSDGYFDLVFTSAVLQHNLHERKSGVIREIYRVLRPGGYYMFTENTFREDNYLHTFPFLSQWNEDLDDGYSFTSRGWERFLSARGFDLVWFEKPSEYLFIKR